MKIVNTLFICLTISLLSCNNISEDSSFDNVITIDPTAQINCDLSETILKSRFVALETNDSSFVIYPDKVIEFNGKIYILDRRQKALLLFDSKGHYLKKIRACAKPGPGELAEMLDFSVNAFDKTLSALGMFYVAKLTLDLVVIDKHEQHIGMYHHCWISSEKFLFFSNYLNPASDCVLGIYDFGSKSIDKKLILNNNNIKFTFQQPSTFSEGPLGPVICLPFSDTIYQFVKNANTALYRIDFGKFSMNNREKSGFSMIKLKEMEERKLAFNFVRYFENENFRSFSYKFLNRYSTYFGIKDLKVEYSVNKFQFRGAEIYFRPVGFSDSHELVVWFEPDFVKQFSREISINETSFLSIDSNPVLCFISNIYHNENF